MTARDQPKTDAAYHSFDAKIAARVGVNAAVVYRNLVFWVRHNETNRQNFHEGRYWTYNALTAFDEQFPYLTIKQIRTSLDKLLEAGLILKGNFAADRFNRANWYALGETICPERQVEKPDEADDRFAREGSTSARQGNCIKNRYKPDSKPYPQGASAGEVADSGFDAIWKAYPEDRRRDRTKCKQHLAKALDQVSLDELAAAVRAYAIESADFQRSKVSFIDNWLRDEKWQRHVDDLRLQSTDNGGPTRSSCPVSALRVISGDDKTQIAEWNSQLARWSLPPLNVFAGWGKEHGKEGWLWPLQWVPSDSDQLSRVEKYARWLLEAETEQTSKDTKCRHAG